jgi:hypothetical protein
MYLRNSIMAALDFDHELSHGVRAYNGKVGEWWSQKTSDAAHLSAYSCIADHVMAYTRTKKGLIIDYACGNGILIDLLRDRLGGHSFLGIDGAKSMLPRADSITHVWPQKATVSIQFLIANLPNWSLPAGEADVVLFSFPNIITGSREQARFERKFIQEMEMARSLCRGKHHKENAVEACYDGVFMNRVISTNLHHLLKKGGFCVRADYAQADRSELTEHDQLLTAYEEGSLGRPKLFRLVSSKYFQSQVILDVYEQTKDKDFKEGGYSINVLRAL